MHYSSSVKPDSWTWDIARALRNKFNFKKAKVFYPDSEDFYKKLQTNAKKNYPVNLLTEDYYEHSMICDGYNTDGDYHLNFGWSRNSRENYTLAWYNLPTTLNSEYNVLSQAIMFIGEGITPIQENDTPLVKITLDEEESLVDIFEEDESESNQENSGEGKSTLDLAVNEALESDIPSIGSTNRYVIYEIPPVPIKRVAPKYPTFIKRRGIQGQVWLNVEVLINGDVGEIEVAGSLFPGKGGLDEAAVEAVKKWKFEPAKSSGKSVACWVKFPIIFSLQK